VHQTSHRQPRLVFLPFQAAQEFKALTINYFFRSSEKIFFTITLSLHGVAILFSSYVPAAPDINLHVINWKEKASASVYILSQARLSPSGILHDGSVCFMRSLFL